MFHVVLHRPLGFLSIQQYVIAPQASHHSSVYYTRFKGSSSKCTLQSIKIFASFSNRLTILLFTSAKANKEH